MAEMQWSAGRRARGAFSAAALALVAALLVPGPARAAHYTNTAELSATTNTGAAIAWSKATFPLSATEVLLGRDDLFADSLASGSMQGSRPLLLTASQTLSADTNAELTRLKPSVVNIMGGASAVSVAVENDLRNKGYEVRRFSGPTRIETAIDIARRVHVSATAAILARAFAPQSGDPTGAFADSISAGGWAADTNMPVLLTESDRLSTSTRNYLRGSRIRTVYVVGGTSAVSESTIQELRAIGMTTVRRVSGATRFDTAVEVAKERGFADAAKATDVILTEGQASNAWAAGFAAGAYAAARNAPVVLANGANLPAPTESYLSPVGGAAGTKLVCGPGVQSAPCDAASSAMGHTAVSGSAPRLVAAALAQSTTPGQSEVHLTFSEPLSGTVSAEGIRGYTFDAFAIASSGASRHSTRPDTVVATFPSANFSEVTTVGVAFGAVRNETNGTQGMEGSAGVQGATRSGGNSRGPNLIDLDLENGDGTTSWDVSFEFDKPISDCGAGSNYVVVMESDSPDGSTSVDRFTGSGTPDEISATECEVDFTVNSDSDFDDVSRGFVRAGTVSTTGINGESFPNPATATSGSTPGPDLTGFSVDVDASQVTFEFDQDLQLVNPTTGERRNFLVYDSRGNTVGATSAALSSNLSRVTATFTTESGVLRNAIMGVAVENNAVQGRIGIGTGASALLNAADEEPSGTRSFDAGKTTGPILTRVTRSQLTGNTGTRIRFEFNQRVDESTGGFFVYGPAGERTALTAAQCGVDGSEQTRVDCDVPSNASNIAAVRAAVHATIARDAVRPDGQASMTGSSPNPEAWLTIAS